jgi:hypothetical protein
MLNAKKSFKKEQQSAPSGAGNAAMPLPVFTEPGAPIGSGLKRHSSIALPRDSSLHEDTPSVKPLLQLDGSQVLDQGHSPAQASLSERVRFDRCPSMPLSTDEIQAAYSAWAAEVEGTALPVNWFLSYSNPIFTSAITDLRTTLRLLQVLHVPMTKYSLGVVRWFFAEQHNSVVYLSFLQLLEKLKYLHSLWKAKVQNKELSDDLAEAFEAVRDAAASSPPAEDTPPDRMSISDPSPSLTMALSSAVISGQGQRELDETEFAVGVVMKGFGLPLAFIPERDQGGTAMKRTDPTLAGRSDKGAHRPSLFPQEDSHEPADPRPKIEVPKPKVDNTFERFLDLVLDSTPAASASSKLGASKSSRSGSVMPSSHSGTGKAAVFRLEEERPFGPTSRLVLSSAVDFALPAIMKKEEVVHKALGQSHRKGTARQSVFQHLSQSMSGSRRHHPSQSQPGVDSTPSVGAESPATAHNERETHTESPEPMHSGGGKESPSLARVEGSGKGRGASRSLSTRSSTSLEVIALKRIQAHPCLESPEYLARVKRYPKKVLQFK